IGRRGSYRLGLTETRAAVPYPVAATTVVTTELAPAVARRAVLLARNGTPENALADGILDEVQDGEAIIARALDVARELAALPRSAYASIKRQLRATALERIAAVLATGADPLVETWLGAETASAAAELLGRAGWRRRSLEKSRARLCRARRGGRGHRRSAAREAGEHRTGPRDQCPAATSAATVNQSSVMPCFSPWLKYQPCSPGKRWLGSAALVACSSCMSTMTIAGWKPISSSYSMTPAPSKAFFRKLQSLIQIFHSSPERS